MAHCEKPNAKGFLVYCHQDSIHSVKWLHPTNPNPHLCLPFWFLKTSLLNNSLESLQIRVYSSTSESCASSLCGVHQKWVFSMDVLAPLFPVCRLHLQLSWQPHHLGVWLPSCLISQKMFFSYFTCNFF